MVTKFYFPLTVSSFDYNEYGDVDYESECQLDGRYAACYANEILEKFLRYTAHDDTNMAVYFDCSEDLKNNITNMDWRFELKENTLFGVVEVGQNKPFSETDIKEIKDFITGQNSDGLGEGFEQQEIETDEGVMFVHFWDSDKNFFVDTEDEFLDRLQQIETDEPLFL